ncbi:LemA family protein [Candidatus Poribacteria bacterium]
MARKKTAFVDNSGAIVPEEPVILQTMPLERTDALSEMYPDLFPSAKKRKDIWNRHTKLATALIVLLIVAAYIIYSYNSYVNLLSIVTAEQAQIDSELQRRSDLVPNLVESMGIYTVYENKLVSHLAEVRSEVVGANGAAGRKPKLVGSVEDAISKLLAIVEQYPDLKANTTFEALMTQLGETEDRIVEQRNTYNAAAREYNNKLQAIPGCVLRYTFRLKLVEYFEADEEVRKLPIVELDLTKIQEKQEAPN